MEHAAFREWAHRLADWMADYREHVGERSVLPDVSPGDVSSRLPRQAPTSGEDMERIVADFEDLILPGMTCWQHPRFFAYFPANTSGPSILAEMLTATLGAQCMNWQTSPAATELEQVVLDWLRGMIGLPEGFHGVIQDTASSASLVALLMARERATGGEFRRQGARAPRAGDLRVYCSGEAHSSIEKGVFLAGIGSRNLRRIATDAEYAMDPDALRRAITEDRERGLLPAAVVATLGTTSTTAMDPLAQVAAICRREDVFLHVDAAYAGNAAILPEKRPLFAGLEHADSVVFNPHKWLFTNFDCSAHFVRDERLLLETCAIDPEYLKTPHDERVINYRDHGIPLGRRFRALKLWFVLRSFGQEGLQARLREHLRLAQEFARRVEAHPAFELAAPVPFGLVCFRLRAATPEVAEQANQALLERVNASGRVFMTHTRLDGRLTLRLSVGQELTREADVLEAWDLVAAGVTSS